MNNYPSNGLNNNRFTPIKRLGLSRKRRNSYMQVNASVCSSKNGGSCSETEIKKENIASVELCHKNLNVKENFEDKSEKKSELVPNILDAQSKYVKEIEELENLYSIWVGGFKNAFSYLISLLEKRSGESVNIKQLLIQLRIWEIISDHFKDDLELGCFLQANEDID